MDLRTDQGNRGVRHVISEAQKGDPRAWEELIDRYQSLVNSITRRYRLSEPDAADVSQTVWLKLIESVGSLRDPEAIPGWISTTTGRACLDVLARAQRTVPVDPLPRCGEPGHFSPAPPWDEDPDPIEVDEQLLQAELRRAVRLGLAELALHEQDLLVLLVADPRPTYQEISEQLGLPIGSIGPNRARYLKKLERTGAVRSLQPPLESGPEAA
jgi:RNA polymerase sigma factor (sigma-70 family)